MSRRLAWLSCMLSLFAAFAAQAQVRAWIDRDSVALGDTLTLNIETDGIGAASPDYAPLQKDFIVSGNSSSRQVQIVNGKTSATMLFAVALQPRREGLLTIPALQVGSQRTLPIPLTVTNAAPPAQAGSPAFIEAEVDDEDPYVQQAVGFTLRLYYEAPLVSGQLDQDEPDGASLQRVGQDLQYTRQVGGKRYQVVERRFLLVPERSGQLTIPGARFEGRGAGGFFDDMFGDGEQALKANGAPRFLHVRPQPANAPQPWLPLRGLGLRYLDAPRAARAGEAATVVVEATADGATAAQMPQLQLPAVDGAQVFADPAQTDETFDNGRPQVKITRKFSIVPARAGTLRIPGPRIAWWDVRAGAARTASLPDISLQVAPAAPGAGMSATTPVAPGNANVMPVGDRAPAAGMPAIARPWALATIVFALLWLATLVWGMHRRVPAAKSPDAGTKLTAQGPPAVQAGLRGLKKALDTGTLGEAADTLCRMAQPPAADLDAVLARLDDPAQHDAVMQLQRARWGDGDAPAARAALRAAFAGGPRWKPAAKPDPSPLPPLYPQA